MKTNLPLLGLCLSLLACAAASAALPVSVLSARPVEAIDARIALPGRGTIPAQFRPGEISLRMPSGTLELSLDELQSIRYPNALNPDAVTVADPDECRVVTVHGDVLVGRCPFKTLQRLLKASTDWPEGTPAPGAISFSAGSVIGAPAAGETRLLKLSNGSLLHVRPQADTLEADTGNGSVSLPWTWMTSIVRDAGTDTLRISLADAPYAMQAYLPRGSLQVLDTKDRKIDFPWSDIVSLSLPKADTPAGSRISQAAVITIPTNDTPITVPVDFPVTAFSFRSEAGDLPLPSTRLRRAVRNPDRTWTVFTLAGDILTGRFTLPALAPVPTPDGQEAAPADAVAIDFRDTATLPVPDDAMAWRLDSGDILVGTWEDPPDLSAPSMPPIPSTSRIAAVRPAASGAAARTPPQRNSDGTWPLRRYTVRLLATGTTVELAAKSLEAVCFLPVTDLPPARVPAGPSAFASDEVEFPGATFRMGRTGGEGNPDETPAVDIQVAPFRLSTTPVTVAQFRAFVDDTGYETTAERMSGFATWRAPGFPQTDDDPVVCISWLDAARYCNWRSKQARLTPAYDIRDGGRSVTLLHDTDGYRLPLEAEWEYAARDGGRDILFPWGDEASEGAAIGLANFRPEELALDPWPNTNPVKAIPAAANGLYGMSGNVWEWCQDVYDPRAYATAYRIGAIDRLLNPAPGDQPEGKRQRVIRGGSYYNPLGSLRCTARACGYEQMGAPRVGMRLARDAR